MVRDGKNFWDTADEFANFLHLCHALITISGHSDYSNRNLSYRGGSDIYEQSSEYNPQLTCKSAGTDTQDYPQCSRLITLYESFAYGKKAKQTVDVVRQDNHFSKQRDRLHKERMKGGTVGTEDVLATQKESFKKQKAITGENIAINTAELGALSAVIKSMPTVETLMQNECVPRMRNKGEDFKELTSQYKIEIFNKYIYKMRTISLEEHIMSSDEHMIQAGRNWAKKYQPLEVDSVCSLALNTFRNLIMNTNARKVGKSLIIQSGLEATANLLRSNILKDRIKGLDGAIKKIEGFEPKSLTEEQMEEIYLRECTVNPTLPKCREHHRKKVDGVKNSYSFEGGSTPTLIGRTVQNENDNGSNGSPNVDRSKTSKEWGISLPGSQFLGGGEQIFCGPLLERLPMRARGKAMIPAVAAVPGPRALRPLEKARGGGGGGDRDPPGDSSPAAKVAYDGSGGGWKGYGSGGGMANKQAKGNDNPFGGLFKNKREKGQGGDVMEFRQPASKTKAHNIFHRISNRYREASKGKKLLEYSVVEEEGD